MKINIKIILFSFLVSFGIILISKSIHADAGQTYELILNDGTGSGFYTEGSTVTITAQKPISRLVFDHWVGSTFEVNHWVPFQPQDPLNPTTSFIMPAKITLLSAVYVSAPANQQSALIPADSFGHFINELDPSTGKQMEITYNNSMNQPVSIIVYNLKGTRIRELDADDSPGDHTAYWDGNNDSGEQVATDVYVLVLKAGNKTQTKRIGILK